MRIRPLFPFGTATHRLGNGSIRFVTRRTALTSTLASAALATLIALAAGAALGKHWAERAAEKNMSAHGIERNYIVNELGKLNAFTTQMSPRVDRLAERIGELQGIQARLKTPLAPKRDAKAKPSTGSASSEQGGPELPPQGCADENAQPELLNVSLARRDMDCLSGLVEQLEDELASYDLAYAALPGRLPVQDARFVSSFGNRSDPFNRRLRFHSGVDFAARTGTPILATAGGRVVFSGEKPGYGLVVEIDHGNGYLTRYGHASRLVARKGDVVLPEQHIADVGSTGRSTGPHLHFEIMKNGSYVDPSRYLALFEDMDADTDTELDLELDRA